MKNPGNSSLSRRKFLKSTATVSTAVVGAGMLESCTDNLAKPTLRSEPFPLVHAKSLRNNPGLKGLLYSQVGYDLGYPVKVILRLPNKDSFPDGISCELVPLNNESVKSVAFNFWGSKWGSDWFIAEFGIFDKEGEWNVQAVSNGEVLIEDQSLRVKKALLWNTTIELSSVEILDRRKIFSSVDGGWMDAGTLWVESCAQSAMIIGLNEILEQRFDAIDQTFKDRIYEHLIVGCDYHILCFNKAQELGYEKGAISHDVIRNEKEILPRDAALAVISLLKSSRALPDKFADEKEKYKETAILSYNWLMDLAKPINNKGFSTIQRGLSAETIPPDNEWMTRDLVSMCWGALELWKSGVESAKETCIELSKQIMARQIQKNNPEAGYYGHFKEFDSMSHTENSWTHGIDNKIFGVDLGGIYPNYLMPFVEMIGLWSDHEESTNWKQSLRNYAFGFLIPSCKQSPFSIIPLGIFGKEGPVFFAGPFHGTNTIYGYTAALSMELYKIFGDDQLKDIAIGNLQWIAGLNAGITKENMKHSLIYSTDVPEGLALPSSMICGVGKRWAGSWFQTRGVVCNGFSVGRQFRIDTMPTQENDGPSAFTDEDWIPHSASWITGLTRL